jgi:hypothetical protein
MTGGRIEVIDNGELKIDNEMQELLILFYKGVGAARGFGIWYQRITIK